jgi:hypothetical protein
VHPATEAQFFFGEAVVVMTGGKLHGVMIWKMRLQNDFAGEFTASGSACYLR